MQHRQVEFRMWSDGDVDIDLYNVLNGTKILSDYRFIGAAKYPQEITCILDLMQQLTARNRLNFQVLDEPNPDEKLELVADIVTIIFSRQDAAIIQFEHMRADGARFMQLEGILGAEEAPHVFNSLPDTIRSVFARTAWPDAPLQMCSTCGASWNLVEYNRLPDCPECGGFASHRSCTYCGGACKKPSTRNVEESNRRRAPIWHGGCKKPAPFDERNVHPGVRQAVNDFRHLLGLDTSYERVLVK